MTIKQLTQNGAVLEKAICYRYDDAKSNSVSALTFQFKGGEQLALSVNGNTDELAWIMPADKGLKPTESSHLFPFVADAYGLLLTGSWEMKNHQDYFDAVQLELTNVSLKQTMIVQFKAAASNIEVYQVNRLSSPKNQ